MKRESKVISLVLAKKIVGEQLKLGIHADAEWFWCESWWNKGKINCYTSWSIRDLGEAENWTDGLVYPAFDTSELGELMKGRYIDIPTWHSEDSHWHFCFNHRHIGKAKEEAEARGKMYLWLLDNGYITGKEEV